MATVEDVVNETKYLIPLVSIRRGTVFVDPYDMRPRGEKPEYTVSDLEKVGEKERIPNGCVTLIILKKAIHDYIRTRDLDANAFTWKDIDDSTTEFQLYKISKE